ncbi:hypothetical protein ACPOL_4234 [Acidisarcina polymorpha]|uniref:Uncharacterized protein n=1 Tax=Acidisarcina polymorpha TaxID=2211140 RepID=A0A2Z5G307_9BACT|nr:hypothetical protein ACPOL_4234 [Acidisarcina polymorpha]
MQEKQHGSIFWAGFSVEHLDSVRLNKVDGNLRYIRRLIRVLRP